LYLRTHSVFHIQIYAVSRKMKTPYTGKLQKRCTQQDTRPEMQISRAFVRTKRRFGEETANDCDRRSPEHTPCCATKTTTGN